ncbi:MAG: DUF1190 domain-containing protein [Alphaproteobacteria bacterium]|nr:DUF1190 domain-containing protein [Alphaproteobacteria bacterium]
MQSHDVRQDEERSYAFIVVIALLIAAFVAIVVALIMRRDTDYALVLATPQDCLRAFDETKCRAIVARAMEIQASTGPRFDDQRVCEMQYGFGNCMPATVLNQAFYTPGVAAIVLARGLVDDPNGMIPLYFDSGDKGGAQGRRVLFRGRPIGILRDKRFGGAAISVLTDLSGKPLTSKAIKRLRG